MILLPRLELVLRYTTRVVAMSLIITPTFGIGRLVGSEVLVIEYIGGGAAVTAGCCQILVQPGLFASSELER